MQVGDAARDAQQDRDDQEHGGEVEPAFDGGPDAWFTPEFTYTGSSWKLPGGNAVTNVYTYPNGQETATLWFHDHALGVTRLNVYAGLAGFYLLRDERDNGRPDNTLGLPAGDQEIEIAIQDRMFNRQGELYFPAEGENAMTHPFWIPEFTGNVIVVNGKTWPYLEVEPRRYRFHFLNGSNSRFYQLFLEDKSTASPGPASATGTLPERRSRKSAILSCNSPKWLVRARSAGASIRPTMVKPSV